MLSVIIPVYNAENEIKNCIDNILQTNNCDFEVILVNDGSTDNTKNILDGYALQSNKIKVINQDNAGVSKARDIGIEHAKGNYIIFVDSDDKLEDRALDYLSKRLENEDIDILQYSFSRDTYNSDGSFNKTPKYYQEKIFQNTKDAFSYLVVNGLYFVWNKAYKTSFIQNYHDFPLGIKTGEDLIFNCKAILRNPKIACTEKILYHYIRTDKDTTVTRFIDNMDITFTLKKEALLSVFQHFNLNQQSYYNRVLSESKFYVFNLFHVNSKYTKNEIIFKLQKHIYSEPTYAEISKAIPNNKSMKLFQILVLHSNAKLLYKYFFIRKKIKTILKR